MTPCHTYSPGLRFWLVVLPLLFFLGIIPECPAQPLQQEIHAARNAPRPKDAPVRMEPVFIERAPQPDPVSRDDASLSQIVKEADEPSVSFSFPATMWLGLGLGCCLVIGLMFWLKRKKDGDDILVVYRDQRQLISLRCREKNGTIECVNGHIIEDPEKRPDSVNRLLVEANDDSATRLVAIFSSERAEIHALTLPLLRPSRQKKAVITKLRQRNISYDPEQQELQFFIRHRNREEKKMSVVACLFPRQDAEFEWGGLKKKPNLNCPLALALLSALSEASDKMSGPSLLAYRLNSQELVTLLVGEKSITSRRLYSLEEKPTDQWQPYLPNLEQMLEFYYRQQQQLVSTVFLAGKSIGLSPDPSGAISRSLRSAVEGINLCGHVDCTEPSCARLPGLDLLLGAASLSRKIQKG